MTTIQINSDGSVTSIGEQTLGLSDYFTHASSRRVSHIEPCSRWLRVLFHLIRRMVKDDSAMAGATRRWSCRWRVNMRLSGGPVFGCFDNRADAIKAEHDWLNSNLEAW